MPLEVHDTVVLKNDPEIVGTVERTHATGDSLSEIQVEDLLILNYTDVPEHILKSFALSWAPPKGYVFVVCIQEDFGAFIAHEDDLTLLGRCFDLGDIVKQHGQTSSMIGTVIDVEDTYNLRPALREAKDGRLESTSSRALAEYTPDNRPGKQQCGCQERQYDLIENVPEEDLSQAVPAFVGDLALRDDWVGTIDAADYNVVILHQDKAKSIGVLDRPSDLHIPILHPAKPLVNWPLLDGLERPPALDAFQGWSTIPAPAIPRLGSFITTSKSTLEGARWLQGQYEEGPRDYIRDATVIAVVPRNIDVKWITANPFTRKAMRDVKPPSRRQVLFKNINSFTSQSDLIRKNDLKLCSSILELSGASSQEASVPSRKTTAKPVGALQELVPGDQVRFRDSAAATKKYVGRSGCGCGSFKPIDSERHCPGFDVNFLDILSQTQMVKVQWQNGTETKHAANNLVRFDAFETPMTPGNVVLDKAGLKMARASNPYGSVGTKLPVAEMDFNEMAFFERPHDLVPSRVGIVQAIDTTERIAKVRWFESPKVALIDGGEVIHPFSRCGRISETVQELSLYEIMTFPAFDWRLQDSVMLPPSSDHLERLRHALRNKDGPQSREMPLAVNSTLDLDRLVIRAKVCMKDEKLIESIFCSGTGGGDGKWVGDIVGIGLDGNLTVRLVGGKTCRDVQVPLDVVLAIINLDELGDIDYDGDDDLEEFWEEYPPEYDDYSRSPSPISEHIEYEGGQRMDEDEDDDAWVSAEEDLASLDSLSDGSEGEEESGKAKIVSTDSAKGDPGQEQDVDVEMTDASTQTAAQTTSGTSNFFQIQIPDHAPPAFEVLSIEPPRDQYSINFEPNTSPSFLKRIAKEHKVLATSLPAGQIYVRTYESRLDLLRCLIIGPPDTPYEDAPFLIDLHLSRSFPQEPPVAHFHSWTSGLGRINPNLYEEGKICLSLLGTWPGKESQEGWSKDATILQILVSIQGLVMVRNPFFNEAGFEGYEAEGQYKPEAAQYAEKAFVMSRGFVKHALTRPPGGLVDVLGWLYSPTPKDPDSQSDHRGLLERILQRGQSLIQKSQKVRGFAEERELAEDYFSRDRRMESLMDAAGGTGDPTKAFLRPLSKGAIVMLRRWLGELQEAAGPGQRA